MSLALIVGLALFSPLFWCFVPFRHRIHTLLVVSVLSLYGLQSLSSGSHLAFVFPTTLVVMVVGVGLLIRPEALPKNWHWSFLCLAILVWVVPSASPVTALLDRIVSLGVVPSIHGVLSLIVILGGVGISFAPFLSKIPSSAIVVGFGLIALLARVIAPEALHISSSPLEMQAVLLIAASLLLGIIPLAIPPRVGAPWRSKIALIWLGFLIGLQVILKWPTLNLVFAHGFGGQVAVEWFSLSYVSFRLLHVVLDFHNGALRLKDYSLVEFVVFALFFPTLSAGPITRLEATVPQLRQNLKQPKLNRTFAGLMRILTGLAKKFVMADLLGIVALRPQMLGEPLTPTVAWLMMYAFVLMFYFDFSGYTDTAIGLGLLYGLELPENFERPFTKPNIAQFWQSWHITLTTWFRLYWFVPFSRWAMKHGLHKRTQLVLLLAQLSTMSLIALWHQITLGWWLWGIWQGIGLSAFRLLARPDNIAISGRMSLRQQIIRGFRIGMTITYVALGFVFVALPNTPQALRFFGALLGHG